MNEHLYIDRTSQDLTEAAGRMLRELPLIGTEFAGYQLRAVIDHGGMSIVYQAENPRLGSAIALKVLPPPLSGDDVFRTRFLKESRVAASLNHPNVIPVYDMGAYEDLLYIAMRYVSGTDLRRMIKKDGRIAPDCALSLVGQAARALDAAHREGLVHRDVKPGNLLIEQGSDDGDPDHLYLADFGISKHVESHSGLTLTGQLLGTVDYIAPEQITGQPVTGQADQYSLGCVMYECLTGRVPFEKDLEAAILWAHVEESPDLPTAVCAELPPGLDAVFARVLAKQPADRYPSCREFVDAARAALAVGPAGAARTRPARTRPPRTRPAISRPSTGRSRHRWLAALAAVVLITAGTSAWLLSGGGRGYQPHRAMAMPRPSASASQQAPASPLMAALALVNVSADAPGKLPPSSCRPRTVTAVTCTAPAPGITEAAFRTYPSLATLYAAYTAAVAKLDSGHFQANFGDCETRQVFGELSWNHEYAHLPKYSVAQLASGLLNPATQAAGRVFCNYVNGQEYIIWTQNDGHLLAMVDGPVHGIVWEWWFAVHHSIGFSNSPMQMRM
jgi:serine/threonine protein kinase